MPRQPNTPPITLSRRQHSIYVTDDIWEALNRRHLEVQLTTPEPPSKIEFLEDVIRRGLAATGSTAEPRRRPSMPTKADQPGAPAVEEGRAPAAPDAPRSAVTPVPPSPPESTARDAEDVPAAEPAAPVKRSAAPAPRRPRGAVAMLLQASDPGQPARIRSAADDPSARP